ncbi:MAG: type II toxin-antitoxin system prevent-host-death family antitoxin [Actinobacteria bacterium]|nr:type II toxin-antitoxin system prevent-host-death family antitoxin [Actinomycetota bacterium]
MESVTVSQARAALPEILDRVLAGEEVTLTRHGVAVAVVVRPDVLRSRRAEGILQAAAQIGDALDQARHIPISIQPTMSAERADELVAAVRAGRRRRAHN